MPLYGASADPSGKMNARMFGSAQRRIARAFNLGIAERSAGKSGGKTKTGESNGHRNDTFGHPRAGVVGCDSDLASQQGMGLWSQRRSWSDTGDRVDFTRAGKNIAVIFHRAECSAYNRSKRT